MALKGKISIVTATYNAKHVLPGLIASLREQTDLNFEWVVADGASTDGTLELLMSIKDLDIKIISQEDFGIYDALNRGVKACSGDYYLVIGADDIFYPNAIEVYRAAIEPNVSFVTAGVDVGDVSAFAGRSPSWKGGHAAYFSCHAVGVLIKKKLHDRYGFYSRRYPILADQLFLLSAAAGNEQIKKVPVVVGRFNEAGVSSIDRAGTITELYRVQLQLGSNKFIQTLLCCFRLLKNIITSK